MVKEMRRMATLITVVMLTLLGAVLSKTDFFHKDSEHAFAVKEPLLIEGEKQNSYSILPVGTVLYLDKSWPEGHSTYHVYFHFKGDLKASAADGNVIAPLWLRTVDRDEVTKLLSEYPLSKDDLVAILKAKKMTRDDLAQIVREWKD